MFATIFSNFEFDAATTPPEELQGIVNGCIPVGAGMRTITVQRAADRFLTDAGWLHSRHNFNFGHHFHPAHQGHGLLLVNNDDVVAPGQGFGTHGHRDMEIVTWVLSGRLEHEDSAGNHGVLYPGLAQRMSAGSGIRHSEMNASRDEPVHFVQMWVLPDTPGIDPGYEQRDLNDALATGGMVPLASGQGHERAITIHQRDAVLWGARLQPGEEVVVPAAPHVHVFVAVGGGALQDAGELATGDAARLTDAGTPRFTAGAAGAELLVWATA
jgi:redox-sensitive bicupin YhaK (pirin superfamily)